VRRFEDAHATGEVIRRVPAPVWEKMLAGVATADARPFLPHVRAPALIIHDPENTYVPVEAAQYLHEHLPNSRLLLTDEAADPALSEQIYRAVREFTEEVALRAAGSEG
jgi:pimeloyl-ACP methyl ester carboxylesterase